MTESTSKTAEMSFWDHLDDLRGMLIRSVVVLFVCSGLGLFIKDFLFDGIILAPTRADFCVYRLLGWNVEMNLINIEISSQFFVHLKACLAVGLIMTFPYIVWEIWRFIVPALYKSEKKAFSTAFSLASLLFYIGVLVGYFIVLPVCLQFFLNYSVSSVIENSITLNSYMSMFMSMVLLIGVIFEFPTIVLVLSRLGVVNREILRKGRKVAIMIALVFSAAITPADPFSMLVLALPLYLLYELSILLCKSEKTE